MQRGLGLVMRGQATENERRLAAGAVLILLLAIHIARPATADAVTPDQAGRLIGVTWYWLGTLMNDGARFDPADPRRYTVQFTSDGHVAVRADCNRGAGTYTVSGQRITISPLAVTRAACPPGSLDQRFLTNLGQAVIFSMRGDVLLLDLKFDSGTMRFSRHLP